MCNDGQTIGNASKAVTVASPIRSEDGSMLIGISSRSAKNLDYYLSDIASVSQILAVDTVIDSKDITLTGGHGLTGGENINIKEGTNFYQGFVIAVNVNVITLDSPLDHIYSTSAYIEIGERNLNLNGAVTPIVAKILPPSSEIWDITRMLFTIEDNVVMDTAKFGGITALTYGIVIRSKRNSVFKNLYNVKSNGGFADKAFDIAYDDKAPAGFYGFRCRRTFNGEEKNGVVIRLDGAISDEFQVIIQDDLTALSTFRITIQGYVFNN